MTQILDELPVALGLLVGLSLCVEAGFRAGRRATERGHAPAGSEVGAIQGSILGLLGLLLAFSFSAAGARFLERQDLIATEANAIGTAWLRADLLDDASREELRTALERYTEHRLQVSAHLRIGARPEDLAEVERLHARIWRAALAGVRERPDTTLAVLGPVNEVIDLHASRIAAGGKHLPGLVLGLLLASSGLALGVIGYGCGLGRNRRAPLSLSLTLLIAAALWVTIDLDHPRAGLLRLSDAPLRSLSFELPSN